MEKATSFLRQYGWAIGFGALFYGVFLYYTLSGNRLCDCKSTENYSNSAHSRGINRFYHK